MCVYVQVVAKYSLLLQYGILEKLVTFMHKLYASFWRIEITG